ncbi:MAG TPA: DUF3887 domain-containing protein [Acidimicrobiales bacterium]|nr:DUF3887 domain-containing protein [Acidimicrobiales bacterium]
MGKRHRLTALAAVVVLSLSAACSDDDNKAADSNTTTSTTAADAAALTAKAAVVADLTARNDWATLRKDFDATMRDSLTEAQLADAWNQVATKLGAFKSRAEPVRYTKAPPNVMVFEVPMTFERGAAKTRVAFNPDGTIAGLFVLPPEAP